MKNNLLTLVVVALVCIASSVTTTKMLTQPAVPKQTVYIYGDLEHCQKEVHGYAKKGFITKSSGATAGDNSFVKAFVIMEKY